MSQRNPSGADRYALLAAPAYFISLLLVTFPLLEVLVGMNSLDVGVVRWRYGAVGLVSSSLLLPLLGVLLAVGTAHLAGHRGVQGVLGGLTALASVVLVAVLVVFALDAVQLRQSIRPEAIGMYDRVSVKAVGSLMGSLIAAVLLAVTSFRSVRSLRPARSARREDAGRSLVPEPATR